MAEVDDRPILIYAPSRMSFRQATFPKLVDAMSESSARVLIVSDASPSSKSLLSVELPGMSVNGESDSASFSAVAGDPKLRRARSSWERAHYRIRRAVFMVVAHRFLRIAGVRGFEARTLLPRGERKAAMAAGNPVSRWLGFPFPRSRLLYGLFSSIFHTRFFSYGRIDRLITLLDPKRVVLMHVQNPMAWAWVRAAGQRQVPVSGMIGSWDQPTTKGHLPRHLERVYVQGELERSHLERFHSRSLSEHHVIGWLSHDGWLRSASTAREELLDGLGIPRDARVLLFGANSSRLGSHEPRIAALIADFLVQQPGPSRYLLVRLHPNDPESESRFASLRDHPRAILQVPELSDLEQLGEMLKSSDLLVSTGGSIALDAIALDRPVVALDYADTAKPHAERIYDLEHNAALVETGGVRLVRDDHELKEAMSAYLTDPSLDRDGRERARALLGPSDGRAAERFVENMLGIGGRR